jgi:hypothetical protein
MGMQKRVWEYQGDMDVLGCGGTFLRHVADRRYHAIRFDNMDEACGRDNEGRETYHGSLVEVDLSVANLQSAAECHGEDAEDHDDEALAFMVAGYGEYAPLHDEASNNGHKLIRELKAESRLLEDDSDAYEAAMNRPVNALGATAREFQRGDMDSAMNRGLRANEQNAQLMAKIERRPAPCSFGVLDPSGNVSGQVVVDMSQTGSDDPLAFAYGFAQGSRGEEMLMDEEDLAAEYVRGHAEGLKVHNGEKLPAFASR